MKLKVRKLTIVLSGIIVVILSYTWIYSNLVAFGIVELSEVELIAGVDVGLNILFFGGWIIIGTIISKLMGKTL